MYDNNLSFFAADAAVAGKRLAGEHGRVAGAEWQFVTRGRNKTYVVYNITSRLLEFTKQEHKRAKSKLRGTPCRTRVHALVGQRPAM
jgi:hypothetical protein